MGEDFIHFGFCSFDFSFCIQVQSISESQTATKPCIVARVPLMELLLSIGNITLRIAAEDPSLKLYADGAKEKFLLQNGMPDVDISVGWRHLVHEPIGKKLFDSGSIWELHSKAGSNIFRFTSLAYGTNPYKLASFNQDFSKGTIHLHESFFPSDQRVDPICYPLDELLLVNALAQGTGC